MLLIRWHRLLLQIEQDKFRVFIVLAQVPGVAVKQLIRSTQRGYDKMRQQLNSDLNDGEDDTMMEEDDELVL